MSVFDQFNNPSVSETQEPSSGAFEQFNMPGEAHPMAKQSPDAWRYINGLVESAARGATGGLIDKGAALGDAAVIKILGDDRHFGDIYQEHLDNYRKRSDEFAEAAPVASKVAYGTGLVGGGIATAPEAAATMAGKMIQGAKLGAGYGAASGVAQAEDTPGELIKGTVEGAGSGAFTGALLPPALRALGVPIRALAAKIFPSLNESAAVGHVADSLAKDAKASGVTPQQYVQQLADKLSTSPDVPLTLADVAGENTQALVGQALKAPGAGRQAATDFLSSRADEAGSRIVGAVDKNIGKGSAYDIIKTVSASQKANAEPLFEKAMQGSGIAPLQDQLASALQAATQQKAVIAGQISKMEAQNSGALAARGAPGADIRAKYMDLHQQLNQAEADRQAALKVFQQAKGDAVNMPGAVWTPRIQQFLEDPILQKGLNEGVAIQRMESLAKGKPFNPTDYAITGIDEAGKVSVGQVPNMRTLQMGKIGLDKIIEGYRDPVTQNLHLDQFGEAVNKVRAAFNKELREINPDYAKANDAWAGDAAAKDALALGQQITKLRPEMIADKLAEMSPSEREFFHQGIADTLRQGVYKTGASSIIRNTSETRPQLSMQLKAAGIPDADAFLAHMSGESLASGTEKALSQATSEAHKPGVLEPLTQLAIGLGEQSVPAVAMNAARTISHLTNRGGMSPEVSQQILETALKPGLRGRDQLAGAFTDVSRSRVFPAADIVAGSLAGRALPDLAQTGKRRLAEALHLELNTPRGP